MKPPVEPTYFSIKETSLYSGLCIRTIRQLMKRSFNPLPHYRIGRKIIRISKIDFDAWITAYRIGSTDKITEIVEAIMHDVK